MNYIDFEELTRSILQVDTERSYWMIRTMGGAFYADFIRNGYVAIGYDEIRLSDIHSLPEHSGVAKDELKSMVNNRCESITNVGHAASQLLRFVREVKVGDVVVIPSVGSNHIAIGIVTEDTYEEGLEQNRILCPFLKRKRVLWKRYCRRSLLHPKLQMLFASRHIVSKINEYSGYIDSMINDFYTKGDTYHIVLKICTRSEASLEDLCNLQIATQIASMYCRMLNKPTDGDVNIKIQMESPGTCRLSSKNQFKIILIGLVIIAINGGGLKFSSGDFKFDLSSPGIVKSISEAADRKVDREMIESLAKTCDSLKIQKPEDLKHLTDMLKARNEIRAEY